MIGDTNPKRSCNIGLPENFAWGKVSEKTKKVYSRDIWKMWEQWNKNVKDEAWKEQSVDLGIFRLDNAAAILAMLDEPVWGKKDSKGVSESMISNGTKVRYINSIMSILSRAEGDWTTALKYYQVKRDELHNTYRKNAESHKKSEKQEENWLDWEDIEHVYDAFKLDNERQNYWLMNMEGKRESRWKEFRAMQEEVLLGCYVLQPPLRNDYAGMMCLTPKEYQAVKDKKENYLIMMARGQWKLKLNDYKTYGVYGEKTIILSKELTKLLRKWIKINDSGWLFVDKQGVPWNKNLLGKKISKIFQDRTGKAVGTSMIRHSYATHILGEGTLEKIKESSEKMCHSAAMNFEYTKS